MPLSKNLYHPYMALGLVCDGSVSGCRPCSHQLGLTYFLTTPVDGARALHLYDINLQLKGVSKPVPSSWLDSSSCSSSSFSNLAAHQNFTFAVIDKTIVVFHRLIPYTVWRGHESKITILSVIGKHLISVDSEGHLFTWQLPDSSKDSPSKSAPILTRILIPPDFVVSSVAHPQTYINKVLLGARDGRTLLLNLRTKKIVHIFNAFPSPVTVLEPSPIIDVVAVGTHDGTIHLHNFRLDKTIVSFRSTDDPSTTSANQQGLALQAISFRTDGIETLATADAGGNLFIWDLNQKRLCSEARFVHNDGVSYVQFLPGEPLLVTAGTVDNAVKVHIFDESKEDVRLLRSREGHYLPPTKVRFCGDDGLTMVSAGLDRELRLVCAVREVRNRPFSQKETEKRGRTARKTHRQRENAEAGDRVIDRRHLLPPVIDIASRNAREKDFEFANIVTIHAGRKEAYSWRMMDGAAHKHVLRPPSRPTNLELTFKRGKAEPPKKKKKVQFYEGSGSSEPQKATCVVMSPCGNFAFLGFSDGKIHSFNLQSGRHQGAFVADDIETNKSLDKNEWGRAHEGGVMSLCVDGCGETLSSTGSVDGKVKFWNVQSRTLNGDVLRTPGNVMRMVWCETSDLLAMSMENFSVLVYDVPTRKLARSFKGHGGSIVDICFDNQGRRLITASMDGTIRTWDLPSGCIFNVLRCVDAPTSVAVCPNDEYLATTHANSLSIRLWVNCERFSAEGEARESVHNFDGIIEEADEETSADEGELSEESVANNDSTTKNNGNKVMPLSDNILTLSSRPSNVWAVLRHLKEVEERNKPKEGVKKGKNAPFFLPTVKGLKFQFDTSEAANKGDGDNNDDDNEDKNDSARKHEKRRRSGRMGRYEEDEELELSRFGQMLLKGETEAAGKMLMEGNAPRVDGELRSLTLSKSIRLCANYFIKALSEATCIELTQAHLEVFLSCHGEALAADEDGKDVLTELLEKQKAAWHRLRSTLDSVICLSSLFSGQV